MFSLTRRQFVLSGLAATTGAALQLGTLAGLLAPLPPQASRKPPPWSWASSPSRTPPR